jgi:hypothetical protein
VIKKILIYASFAVAVVGLAVVMVTSKSYTQLVGALLFYPPLVFFLLKSSRHPAKDDYVEPVNTAVVQPLEKPPEDNVVDSDKREFLKLIGSVGLSLFLYSIFTKRSEALFFGKAAGISSTIIEDSNGNKIDPAESQPTDGFQISEIDEGDTFYCGYTNKLGNWYIMKQDLDTGAFRYVRGVSGFPENWSNRSNLHYDYFYNVFKS